MDRSENKFFSAADIGYHPRLMKEKRNIMKCSRQCSPDAKDERFISRQDSIGWQTG